MPPRRKKVEAALELPLGLAEVVGPPTAPSTLLKGVFCEWFRKHYGYKLYWSGKEYGQAKELLKRAGEGGIDEVMSRAETARSQSWRTAAVTIGVLLSGWNEFGTVKTARKTLTPDELAQWAVQQMEREREEGE